MTPAEVISAVQSGNAKSGWAIYRYNIVWALLGLVPRLLIAGVFDAGLVLFVINFNLMQKDPGLYLIFGVVALVAVIATWMTIKQLVTMLFAKMNMIILTDTAVVKSLRGRVTEYPYTAISQLQLTQVTGNNRMPEHFISFIDTRTNAYVELARNRTFGRAADIYDVLRSRVM